MRLRQRNLKPYAVKPRIVDKETDGTTSESWDTTSHVIQANIQPAGGKTMVEMYGERLAYMLTAFVEINTAIQELDGVCIYVSSDTDPDYKVVAIRRWNTHYVIDLEVIQ